jgi:iron complex outermembrane recepter protein
MLVAIRSSLLLLVAALAVGAQQTGGTISGIVRDTAARPIAGAIVTVIQANRSAETDSAGRFQITGLGDDNFTVRARKIGYRPESWDVKLSKSGSAELKFELVASPRLLDTVRVAADGSCPNTRGIESFLCRRQRPGGMFLD